MALAPRPDEIRPAHRTAAELLELGRRSLREAS